ESSASKPGRKRQDEAKVFDFTRLSESRILGHSEALKTDLVPLAKIDFCEYYSSDKAPSYQRLTWGGAERKWDIDIKKPGTKKTAVQKGWSVDRAV
ncbi:unnamed protein product, partial [Symbiodinium pilosum]